MLTMGVIGTVAAREGRGERVVDSKDRSAEAKPHPRRFRFRFGVRTLLLFTAVVAIWLSIESKRAEDQAALVACIDEMGGTCTRMPRKWIPAAVQRLLDENQGCFVDSVFLEAMQAPTRVGSLRAPLSFTKRETLFEPSEIEAFLQLPGMDGVHTLKLGGTSFTDDILDELSEVAGLQAVTFVGTAVTKKGIDGFQAMRPGCTVTYSIVTNGMGQLARAQREALWITPDLTLFPRAQRGDPNAIKALLATVDEGATSMEETIGRIQAQLERYRRSLPGRDRLTLGDIMKFLKEKADSGDLSAVRDLASFQYRAPFDTPQMLLVFLSRLDERMIRTPLADTLRDGNPEARFLAMKILALQGNVDLLKLALNDTVGKIRLEALLELVKLGGSSMAPLLVDASRDPDSKVREAALRELQNVAGPDGLAVYLDAMEDPDRDVRWQAVHALERYADAYAVQPLIAALDDENSLIRCSAARTLGRIADPIAAPALETATEDTDSFVRQAATTALAKVAAASSDETAAATRKASQ